jgi:hypothetical protein
VKFYLLFLKIWSLMFLNFPWSLFFMGYPPPHTHLSTLPTFS